jgi:hypothetical protein
MGLGGSGRLRSAAPPGGGGDGLASTRDGGVARVLQQVVGALWVYLGPAGPVWA